MENRIRRTPAGQHATASVCTTRPGGLLVDFDTDLGPNRQPLSKVDAGTTVTATVTIRSITPSADGRARGIADGQDGSANFTVTRESLLRLAGTLSTDGRITIRGTVTTVGEMPTIDIWAARAVNV